MTIREGAWDCPYCGRKAVRGPERFCPSCGAPRGDEVGFYLPADAGEVGSAEALARAELGPDWTCDFCEADNPADYDYCGQCGGSRDGARERPVQEIRDESPPPPPAAAPAPPSKERRKELRDGYRRKKKGGRRRGCLWLAGSGLVFLAFVALLRSCPAPPPYEVVGHAWERSVDVTEERTVVREAWEDELPRGIRRLAAERAVAGHEKVQIGTRPQVRFKSERVQTGTERVKVGSRDLGNGYFEDIYEDRPVFETVRRQEHYEEPIYRKKPIYKLKVRFEQDVWQSVRTLRESGKNLQPRWPDPRLDRDQRLDHRRATYEVFIRNPKGRNLTYETESEARWRSFRKGQKVRPKMGKGGKVESLRPAKR